MKSIREYFNSRKLFMFLALALYCLALFFFQLCFLVKGGYVTLFAVISLALVFAVICSILGHRGKDFLFCPKCGSKKIVKTTLFGIPEILYDECPECHEKIDLDKPVNKD
ncbi:MAG: hypothetical protein IIZ08_07890 [Clostridia bacterium]|nr:hypothetical protein [Clostridia bacterium]